VKGVKPMKKRLCAAFAVIIFEFIFSSRSIIATSVPTLATSFSFTLITT